LKILVIQTAFPGDAVLTLPLIQEIRKKYSFSKVDVLCIPSTSILFKSSQDVGKVIEYDKKKEHKGFLSLIKLISSLRLEKYDKIYSPHRSARSALITYFSSPRESYSFNKSAMAFLYKKLVQYREDWHEVRRNLSLLNDSYQGEKWKIFPKIKIEDNQKRKVDEKLQQINSQKIIAIAPGSVWETKKYPSNYFKIIAKDLVTYNYSVILIGGKEDSELGENIKDEVSQIYNLCGEFDFVQSIYLLTQVELLISNDSAPTHLGMCAAIPVLTIYCSTVPSFGFSPYNDKSDYISYDELDCKPCGIHGYHKCPKEHFKCALNLAPDITLDKALSMLKQRHSHHN